MSYPLNTVELDKEEILSADRDFVHPFTNLRAQEQKGAMIIERGKGCYVWDVDGNKYLEGMAGLWCTNLGFGNERLAQVAADQLRKLSYFHNFTHKSTMPAIELTHALKAILPIKNPKILYANSGSEANDTAIKMIWYYNNAMGRPKKKKIIARLKSYHGVTIGAASLTGLPHLHMDFDLPLPQIKHVTCPHYYRYGLDGESEEEFATRLAQEIEDLILKEGPETVAAFFAEPIIGAGGVFYPPKGYFEKVQKVLKKYDVLMVVDEVVCAFGRTGEWFGSNTFNIEPDIMTLAKGITSGYLPLSATVISDKIYQAVADLSQKHGTLAHGYTYSGHPVCAALALENLNIYQELNIVDHVKKVSPVLMTAVHKLADHPLVGNVRGIGLIAGVELVKNKKTKEEFAPSQYVGRRVFEACHKRGVILRAMGDVIGISPPLIITPDELTILTAALSAALDEVYVELKKEGSL